MKNLVDALFWKTAFDKEYAQYSRSVNLIPSYEWVGEIHPGLDEVHIYWREVRGKRENLSPENAAFRAFLDFCDKYFIKNHEKTHSDFDFERLADILASNGTYRNDSGQLIFDKPRLESALGASRWTKYLDLFQIRLDSSDLVKAEIASNFVDDTELNSRISELESGVFSGGVLEVWRALVDRGFTHDIAKRANLSIGETVVWIQVLRTLKLVIILNDPREFGAIYCGIDLYNSNFDLDIEPYDTFASTF